MFYWFSYYVIKMLGAMFSPRTVKGLENLPTSGGFIIASNHMSNLDPFLIGLCFNRKISYMAKDSLFRNIILRTMLRWVEAYPVRRETADIRAMRETLRRLDAGFPVVVFPQGTRSSSVEEAKTQSGIGFLAVKGQVPVVPVYIDGSEAVLPKGAKFPKRRNVTLTFGKPMAFTADQSYPDIVLRIMRAIQALADHR